MMDIKRKVIIIGGGASGLAAAISAAECHGGQNVLLLEKNPILGKKLLATGNGRCNLTNKDCSKYKETKEFFNGLGILLREEEEGRVYPYTLQAVDVQEVLVRKLTLLSVEVWCSCQIILDSLEKKNGIFELMVKRGEEFYQVSGENLIVCTGGKAGPQFGATGEGYQIARAFGHDIHKPIPSLVQITSNEPYFQKIKGVRVRGRASLLKKQHESESQYEILDTEVGEIQFTNFGLSGICIFNLSRNIRLVNQQDCYKNYVVILDLFPELSLEELKHIFTESPSLNLVLSADQLLMGKVNNKLIPVILSESGGELSEILTMLKNWSIPVSGTRGFGEAQVTSGGIPMEEIHRANMESKRTSGLFFAGEVLDYDGKCGGFNLQWAWETGILAGKTAKVSEIAESKD